MVILLAAFFSGIALAEEDSGSTHNDVLESLTQEETVSEESPVEQIVVETDTESAQQDPKPTAILLPTEVGLLFRAVSPPTTQTSTEPVAIHYTNNGTDRLHLIRSIEGEYAKVDGVYDYNNIVWTVVFKNMRPLLWWDLLMEFRMGEGVALPTVVGENPVYEVNPPRAYQRITTGNGRYEMEYYNYSVPTVSGPIEYGATITYTFTTPVTNPALETLSISVDSSVAQMQDWDTYGRDRNRKATLEGSITDIVVTNEWFSTNQNDPIEQKVILHSDDGVRRELVISPETNEVTFANLPKFHPNGQRIIYSIETEDISGVATEIAQQEENGYRWQIKNHVTTRPIHFKKIDEDSGVSLAGAVFELYRRDPLTGVETLLEQRTSNATGGVHFSDWRYGTYVLKETVPPTGYHANPTPHLVSIGDWGVAIDGVVEENATVANLKITGSLAVHKVDDRERLIQEAAKFRLTRVQNGEMIELTTENGVVTIERMEPGEYRLQEIQAPIGHTKDEVIHEIAVSAVDGSVRVDGVLVEGEPRVYKVVNDRKIIQLPLMKVNHYTSAALAGVTFVLTEVDTDTSYESEGTDENGMVTFPEVFPGTYQLQEVVSPIGYVIDNTTYELEVSYDVEERVQVAISPKPMPDAEPMLTWDDENHRLVFRNRPVSEYPATGGMGTWVFTLAGLALMVWAAVAYRRKER